jgi:phosphate:Na+ symporter
LGYSGFADFQFFLREIDSFLSGPGFHPFESQGIPVALAVFHTVFNVLNAMVLIGFASVIARLVVTRLVPLKDEDEEEFRLKYINTGILSTAELSLFQAKKEISVMPKDQKDDRLCQVAFQCKKRG